jgi:hypothetical protein
VSLNVRWACKRLVVNIASPSVAGSRWRVRALCFVSVRPSEYGAAVLDQQVGEGFVGKRAQVFALSRESRSSASRVSGSKLISLRLDAMAMLLVSEPTPITYFAFLFARST